MKKFNVPLLVTGGGGYTKQNVARAWTYETAVLLDAQLPNELPVTEYYEYFRPDYLLKPPVNTLIVRRLDLSLCLTACLCFSLFLGLLYADQLLAASNGLKLLTVLSDSGPSRESVCLALLRESVSAYDTRWDSKCRMLVL